MNRYILRENLDFRFYIQNSFHRNKFVNRKLNLVISEKYQKMSATHCSKIRLTKHRKSDL